MNIPEMDGSRSQLLEKSFVTFCVCCCHAGLSLKLIVVIQIFVILVCMYLCIYTFVDVGDMLQQSHGIYVLVGSFGCCFSSCLLFLMRIIISRNNIKISMNDIIVYQSKRRFSKFEARMQTSRQTSPTKTLNFIYRHSYINLTHRK